MPRRNASEFTAEGSLLYNLVNADSEKIERDFGALDSCVHCIIARWDYTVLYKYTRVRLN